MLFKVVTFNEIGALQVRCQLLYLPDILINDNTVGNLQSGCTLSGANELYLSKTMANANIHTLLQIWEVGEHEERLAAGNHFFARYS